MVSNPFSRDPAVTVGVGADTDEFNDQIGDAGESLLSFRQKVGLAGAALGALATGALAKSVSAAADFEEAMVEVEKVTSPETAEEMSESIRELSEEIPVAQSQLAALAADAGRFGVEGTENIEAFTETVAKMAEATNLGAEEAGESLARLAELTNTPVSEIENLGSSINSLSNNFATSSQEIVDSMLRSSASLSQLGLNQKEIAGLSASLNEVSESSERAGTRLRRLGQELLNPKNVSDLAAALGMTASEFRTMREESPNELIREMATAMSEGGDQADQLRSVLSTTSRQALGALGQNLEGAEEAQTLANESFREGESLQREFEAATDTFNAQLQLFKNRLGNVAIEIGNVLLPPLTNALEKVNDWLSDSKSLVNQLSAQEKAWGLVAAAIGGAATAIAGFLPVGGALEGALAALTGPLGIAAAGLVAFGAAYESNFAGIGTRTDRAVAGFKNALSGIGPSLNDLSQLWRGHFTGENGIAANTRTAMDSIERAVRQALDALQAAWERFDEDVLKIVRGLFGTLDTVVSVGMDGILTTANTVLDLLSGDFEGAWSNIKGFTKRTIRELDQWLATSGKDLLVGSVGVVVSAIEATIGALLGVGGWIYSEIASTFESIENYVTGIGRSDIKGAFRDLGAGIRAAVLGVFGAAGDLESIVQEFFTDLVIYVGSGQALTDTTNAFDSLVDGVVDVFEGAFERGGEIWSTITGLFDAIKTYVASGQAYSDMASAFDTLINDVIMAAWEGLVAGLIGKSLIPDMFSQIARYVRSTGAQKIRQAFEAAVDNVMAGVAYLTTTGDNSLYGDVTGALLELKRWVASTGSTLLGSTFGGLAGDVESALGWLLGTGRDSLYGNATGALLELKRWVASTGETLYDATFGGLVDGVADAVDWLTGTGSGSLYGGVTDALTDLSTWIQNTASSDISGAFGSIASGIESTFDIDLSPIEDGLEDIVDAGKDAVDWLQNVTDVDVNVDWPDPPSVVEKAINGNLNIDWPDPPSGLPNVGFDSGGLATGTGMAMLHGSPSRPEMILSQDETAQASREGLAVGDLDVRDDMEAALSDVVSELRAVRSTIEREMDVDVTVEDSSRYDPI